MASIYRKPHWLITNNNNSSKEANFSLTFDGQNDYITAGNPTELQFTNTDFSVSGWFKSSSSTYNRIVSKDDGTNRCWFTQLENDGRFRAGFFSGNYLVCSAYAGSGLADGNWHHFVFVYDSGTGIKIYIDNASPVIVSNPSTIDNDTVDLEIGRRSDGTNFFNGQLSTIAIFNYVLSSNDVQTLYGGSSNGVGDPTSLTTKPLLYYKLGDELIDNGTTLNVPNMGKSTIGSGNVMSFRFNGVVGSRLTLSSYDIYEYDTNPFTLSFWMKTSTTGLRNIFGGTGFFRYFAIYSGNKLYNYDGSWQALSTTVLTDGQWHHIVCKVGTNTEVFVDGTSEYSSTTLSRWYSSTMRTIGNYSDDTTNRSYNGLLSQVAVFNGTSVSVSDLYNSGVQPNISGMSDLATLYELNQDNYFVRDSIYFKNDVSHGNVAASGNYSSYSDLIGESPNSSIASGVGYNFPVNALKGNAPYSNKNIVSKNGAEFDQLEYVVAGTESTTQITVADTDKFQMTYQTGLKHNDSANKQGCVSISGTPVNATVNWGDGTSDVMTTGNNLHTYANHGTYTITIGPTDSSANNGKSKAYIRYNLHAAGTYLNYGVISIDHWGAKHEQDSVYLAFRGCRNLDVLATDIPTINGTNNAIGYCFESNYRLQNINGSIATWPVGTWTEFGNNFINVFSNATVYNDNLINWDVKGSAKGFNGCFRNTKLFNGDINWTNVSTTRQDAMFFGATKFNKSLSNWTFSGTFSQMFYNASSFNQNIQIGSNATNLYQMFVRAYSYTGVGVENWDVSGTMNIAYFAYIASSFNGNIENWDVSQKTSLLYFAYNAASLNRSLHNWNTSSVTDARNAFNLTALTRLPTNWTSCTLFNNAFTNIDTNSQSLNSDAAGLQLASSGSINFYQTLAFMDNLNADFGGWNISNISSLYQGLRTMANLSRVNCTSTLVRWAIKVYNGTGATGVNAGYLFYQSNSSAGGFDNSATVDSAGEEFVFPEESEWETAGDALDWLLSSEGGGWYASAGGVNNIVTRHN